MRKVFLIVFFPGFAYAQQSRKQISWNLIVVSSQTGKGIEGVGISNSDQKNYTTDLNGKVSIQNNSLRYADMLTFSCIGYKSAVLNIKESAKLPDTMKLTESKIILREVNINYKPGVKIVLGKVKVSHETHMQPYPNQEFAQYIANKKRVTGIIASVNFTLNNDLKGIDRPFKVELLSRSDNNIYPDTSLIKDSIIVCDLEKKRDFSVDISKYNIAVPKNGFFVVFQTLTATEYQKDLTYFKAQERIEIPGINIFLKEKDNFEGYCCSIDWPDRNENYCMLGTDRLRWAASEKKNQWIVYVTGINFAISANIIQQEK